jgi:hypothetical protein
MQANQTLFGERTVSIPDNPTLAVQCNHLLRLTDKDKSLLDGESMGMIDRKLMVAVYEDNGLKAAASLGYEALEEFLMDSKRAPSPDTISRARRWLLEHDYLRVSQKALKDAFNQEKRLAVAFKK